MHRRLTPAEGALLREVYRNALRGEQTAAPTASTASRDPRRRLRTQSMARLAECGLVKRAGTTEQSAVTWWTVTEVGRRVMGPLGSASA